MITALDFLYICLGIGFLILIAVISFTLFSIASFFTTLKLFLKEINLSKDLFKLNILNSLKNILSRGGDKYETR